LYGHPPGDGPVDQLTYLLSIPLWLLPFAVFACAVFGWAANPVAVTASITLLSLIPAVVLPCWSRASVIRQRFFGPRWLSPRNPMVVTSIGVAVCVAALALGGLLPAPAAALIVALLVASVATLPVVNAVLWRKQFTPAERFVIEANRYGIDVYFAALREKDAPRSARERYAKALFAVRLRAGAAAAAEVDRILCSGNRAGAVPPCEDFP
jgi:hypothetical protein